jgi:hypothetical protein
MPKLLHLTSDPHAHENHLSQIPILNPFGIDRVEFLVGLILLIVSFIRIAEDTRLPPSLGREKKMLSRRLERW